MIGTGVVGEVVVVVGVGVEVVELVVLLKVEFMEELPSC